MKFIFVIQGEGRGHFTQAIALWQQLHQEGHSLEKVLIGGSPFRNIPEYVKEAFPCEIIPFASPNFIASATRTRILTSIIYNLAVSGRYFKSISLIANILQRTSADKVINFYEPLCGLAYRQHTINQPMICIAHQYMFLHPQYRFPAKFAFRKLMLQRLTRLTCCHADAMIGLSLKPLPDCPQQKLYTAPPFLNTSRQQPTPSSPPYLLCYLLNAGYFKQIEKQDIPIDIHIFTDHKIVSKNARITTYLLDNHAFAEQMTMAEGIMSTAGFETIAEAMYLHKPVWMVPANFEQKCNAHEAQECGAGWHDKHFKVTTFVNRKKTYVPSPVFKQWVDEQADKILHILTR